MSFVAENFPGELRKIIFKFICLVIYLIKLNRIRRKWSAFYFCFQKIKQKRTNWKPNWRNDPMNRPSKLLGILLSNGKSRGFQIKSKAGNEWTFLFRIIILNTTVVKQLLIFRISGFRGFLWRSIGESGHFRKHHSDGECQFLAETETERFIWLTDGWSALKNNPLCLNEKIYFIKMVPYVSNFHHRFLYKNKTKHKITVI